MKKMILIGLVGVFVIGGCASSSTYTQKSVSGGSVEEAAIGQETKGAVLGAVSDVNPMSKVMDQLEIEMRDVLADWEAAFVRRDGDIVAISLKTDPGFATGSSAVQPEFYTELDQIAQIMVKYPQTAITVEGHTDNTGSDAYNLLLSKRRANRIKHHLVQRGVPTQRITVVGVGESRPAATNTTALGRQMNRRVEILIQPKS